MRDKIGGRKTVSPERALYTNEGRSPSYINAEKNRILSYPPLSGPLRFFLGFNDSHYRHHLFPNCL